VTLQLNCDQSVCDRTSVACLINGGNKHPQTKLETLTP